MKNGLGWGKTFVAKKLASMTAAGAMLAVLLASGDASANRVVVNELKKLRATLSLNDGSRSELSLRLADRLVDEAFAAGAAPAQAAKDRQEAIALYQEVLPGLNPSRQTKVRFQMSRLFLEQGQTAKAEPYLQQVYAQGDQLDLRREASLRLAEIAEGRNSPEAEKYYLNAIKICEGSDSCSYAHYRMGWIAKNRGDLKGAISSLRLALWDSKGQIRDEALRDLILFMGQEPSGVDAYAAELEGISAKAQRKGLLRDLAFSYLGAGNKAPAVRVIEVVMAREPSIDLELKYLEELYGVGPYEKFESAVTHFSETAADPALRSQMVDPKESEKIALRLSIQLDGDRATRPERVNEFQAFALATITLFPKNKETLRLMEGWVAAEKDADARLSRISGWLGDAQFGWSAEDRARLLDMHVGIAQKAGKTDLMIADLKALLALSSQVPAVKKKEREYQYALAYAAYQKKDFAAALPAFQGLAKLSANESPDTWAVQSQNLALDILNQQKDLAGLQSQASTWIKNERLAKNASVSKELQEMRDIADQAEFEQAVALGQSPEALRKFRGFCEAKRFLPKSCENAKTLAVQMGKHADLLAILKLVGPNDEYTAELEAGGYFAESAKQFEDTAKSGSNGFNPWIKTALLYELGENMAERNRVLSGLTAWSDKSGKIPSEMEEYAIASAMEDAGLFEAKQLKSKWSTKFKTRVAESLESRGKASAETKAVITAQKVSTGPAWNRYVAEEVQKVVAKERSISFHGKNSERNFQERVKWVKKLSETVDRYVPGSPQDLRIQMLLALKKSHALLSEQIIMSPIPAGLEAEQETRIREGLAEMAKPFEDRVGEIQKMIDDQIALSTDPAAKQKYAGWVASQDDIAWTASSASTASDAPAPASLRDSRKSLVSALHANPKDVIALTALRDNYRAEKKERIASYFEGRLMQFKQEANNQ